MTWVIIGLIIIGGFIIAVAKEVDTDQSSRSGGGTDVDSVDRKLGFTDSRDAVQSLRARPYATPELRMNAAGVLACTGCGGTQFKARRTNGQRARVITGTAVFGVLGGMASAKNNTQKVQCITCGHFHDRVSQGES